MGHIITLASSKGGAGKSSTAAHLLAEYAARGYRVLGVDADPQGSLVEWAAVGDESGHEMPDVIGAGDNIRSVLPGLAAERDVVIVDTPGREGRRLAGALLAADLALVPVRPLPTDVWAVSKTFETIATVQDVRPELRAAICINGRQGKAVLHRGVRDGLAELDATVLDAELGWRIPFSEAIACGMGVTRYASGSVAALEMRRLADELAELLGLEDTAGETGIITTGNEQGVAHAQV